MAFFSLTTHQEPQQQHPLRTELGPESWYLYRNNNDNNSPYKGFELWQYQQQHQPYQEYDFYSSARGALAVGLGPGGGGDDGSDGPSGSGLDMVVRGGAEMGGVGGISCQDCGNKAKKDCVHMRCRTCCKSRGFECQTHLKSTWVPAAVRRTKHQQQEQLQLQHQQQLQLHIQKENPKRQRYKRLGSSSAGLEMGDFPAEVCTDATFRCVRVSSVNDGDEEYAYQTAVSIGGHVFKGILYDQGPDSQQNFTAGETSTGATTSPAPMFDPCNYPSPLGNFISGTQFF